MRLLPLILAACAVGPPTPRPSDETDAPVAGCTGGPALQWGQDLTLGPHEPGDDVWYGNPPQGGAPYAPFEIRLKADLAEGAPLLAHATATEVGTGTLLGSDQPPDLPDTGTRPVGTRLSVLCSNAGVHAGWWYAGEVHVRFWGLGLDELAGRQIDLALTVELPDGETLDTQTRGTLVRRGEEGADPDEPRSRVPPDRDPTTPEAPLRRAIDRPRPRPASPERDGLGIAARVE